MVLISFGYLYHVHQDPSLERSRADQFSTLFRFGNHLNRISTFTKTNKNARLDP
jgi:hypothetical protein